MNVQAQDGVRTTDECSSVDELGRVVVVVVVFCCVRRWSDTWVERRFDLGGVLLGQEIGRWFFPRTRLFQ